MGGDRYEQLFRATGSVRVAGEEHTFTGSGLRIRRQGVRRLEGFWGHCWQSALFGSGRAFGYIAYPPRPDGQPTFNEGYVFEGDGDLIPASVVEAPWLSRLQPLGEDVSVVLETANGTERIEGETVVSTHDITDPAEVPAEMMELLANWTFPALQQAGVRYRWNGEETIGMLERSIPRTRSPDSRSSVDVVRRQLVRTLQVGLHAVDVVGGSRPASRTATAESRRSWCRTRPCR